MDAPHWDDQRDEAPVRFDATPAIRTEEPLLIGIVGPPGGGKSLSGLKLARGIQSVRGGDIVVLDTEGGRSRKYSDLVRFLCCELTKFDSETMLAAIKAQLPRNPAAIMVDSFSDEHERYLEWHDEMVPRMGGNEWAAWAKPKAARKKLISGILRIKTPLIFTFRAREKTAQNPNAKGRQDKIINIGWQPVAPLEIVHTLDLTCILPPRADGVPVWKSDKIGEDFIIKLPNYLAPYIEQGKPLCEEMGAAFARWAKGGTATPQPHPSRAADTPPAGPPADTGAFSSDPSHAAAGSAPAGRQTGDPAGAGDIPSAEEYERRWDGIVEAATSSKLVRSTWDGQQATRDAIAWPSETDRKRVTGKVSRALKALEKWEAEDASRANEVGQEAGR